MRTDPSITLQGHPFHRIGDTLLPDYLTHGDAKAFITHIADRYCTGKGIDVGASQWPYKDALPVRDEKNRNAYKLDDIGDDSLDYVFSSHCLEHLDRWREALALWVSKVKPGGVVFLYLPHESQPAWNPGGAWVGSGHKWQPTMPVVADELRKLGCVIEEAQPVRDAYWAFHVVGRKLAEPMPRAYLVVGAESSGTRYLTQLMTQLGCEGDADHVQAWDRTGLSGERPVWRKSLPHGEDWPDLTAWAAEVQGQGYDPTIIAIRREAHACATSQVYQRHSASYAEALAKIQRAERTIARAVVNGLHVESVNYEALIVNAPATMRYLAERVGLDPDLAGERISPGTDQNAKHYEG